MITNFFKSGFREAPFEHPKPMVVALGPLTAKRSKRRHVGNSRSVISDIRVNISLTHEE